MEKYVLILSGNDESFIELDLTKEQYKLLDEISEKTYDLNINDKFPVLDIYKVQENSYYLRAAREQKEESENLKMESFEDSYGSDVESHLIL